MKRPICDKCESANVYVTKDSIICRRCGYKKKMKEKEEGEDGS